MSDPDDGDTASLRNVGFQFSIIAFIRRESFKIYTVDFVYPVGWQTKFHTHTKACILWLVEASI
jgi:hypothetical protein